MICSYLTHFPAQAQKKKKINPEKNSLYIRKWNFLALIIKKFLYFLKIKLFSYFHKRKLFLYFWKWNPALFSPGSKNKKIHPRENFLYFRKGKPRKNYLHFLKRKLLLCFGKREPRKIFLYFRKQNFLIFFEK